MVGQRLASAEEAAAFAASEAAAGRVAVLTAADHDSKSFGLDISGDLLLTSPTPVKEQPPNSLDVMSSTTSKGKIFKTLLKSLQFNCILNLSVTMHV